jgi:phospholipid/cholesterol/gamma-HCH transport system substrate-binding protein
MEAIQSPVAFKNYFQTEIDQINTSMSRISMLVDKAQEDEVQLVHTTDFRDNYAELMRQVTEMSNNLKLYNEEFNQTSKQ